MYKKLKMITEINLKKLYGTKFKKYIRTKPILDNTQPLKFICNRSI